MKMRMMLGPILLLATMVFAQAVPPKAAPAATPAAAAPTIASELDRSLLRLEKEFIEAAEAMPEDKYGFAPTSGEFKGVRTFAEQVKHVAQSNYYFFAVILQEAPPPSSAAENGPAALKSKEEILKYLHDSFAVGHRAMATITAQNAVEPLSGPGHRGTVTRLGMANTMIGHCFDHYGQMVEYLRMNGIVPPASRK